MRDMINARATSFLIATMFLLVAQPSAAEDGKEPFSYETVKQFASCAGLYDALASFLQRETGDSPEKEKAAGLSRGAVLAGRFLAIEAMDGNESDALSFFDSLHESLAIEWKVQSRGDLTDAFQEELLTCHEYGGLQAQIIDAMRRNRFGN